MPSTYSPNLRFELTATGEQSGTWGNTNNTNIGTLIEQAISGVASIAMLDADKTLVAANGASDEARNAVVTLTGTLTATRNVIVPTGTKAYTVRNSTTGGRSIVVKTASGTGVTIANGDTAAVYCDGTNVVRGGTSINGATNAIRAATAAFDTMPTVGGVSLESAVIPSGVIWMWSGSVATIPAGWALCNGASGTPDLRDRFVIGAGGSRAPGATGGAASATTSVEGSHSHGAATGGTALTTAQIPSHTHAGTTSTGGSHDHTFQTGTGGAGGVAGTVPTGFNGSFSTVTVTSAGAHSHTFTTDSAGSGQTHNHSIILDGAHTHTVATLPPFFALAFIMKL